MKVLFVATAYPARVDDARGAHVHRLARSLVERGHEVTVVAPGQTKSEQIEIDGVRVVLFRYWVRSRHRVASGVGGIVPAVRQRPSLAFQLVSLTVMMGRSVRSEVDSHDVVHSHWVIPSALIVRVLRRRCEVATAHGADVNIASKSTLGRFLLRFALGNTAVVSAVSEDIAARLRQAGCSRVELTPLGVEVPLAEAPANEDYDHDIVFVGSLVERKNVGLVLRAMRLLEERGLSPSFVVVGDGPKRRQLEAEAGSLNSYVRFLGEVEPQQAVHFIRRSRCLVLPSISEGRPTVVLEAMANDAVVVASDIAGTREMVESDVTGLLFEPGQDVALADCLQTILCDERRASRLRLAARRALVDNGWTVGDASARFEAIYRRTATVGTLC